MAAQTVPQWDQPAICKKDVFALIMPAKVLSKDKETSKNRSLAADVLLLQHIVIIEILNGDSAVDVATKTVNITTTSVNGEFQERRE
jgi:hypothetical protein